MTIQNTDINCMLRKIGEASIEKMAAKWVEGEDISDRLLKHQV